MGLLAVLAAGCGGGSSSSSESSSEASSSEGESSEASSSEGESSEASSSEGEGAGGSAAGKKIVRIGCYKAVPYCARLIEVETEHAEETGVDYSTILDEFNGVEEAAHVNQAISEGAEVIIYEANAQEAMRAPLLKAQSAGIPVVFEGNRPAENVEGLEATYVGGEGKEEGERAAMILIKGLEEAGVKSGKVMIVTGTKGAENVENYLEGYDAEFQKHPQYEVVAEPDGAYDPVKAAQVSQPLIAKYGKELAGISAQSGSMAAAVAKTAEQAGLTVGYKPGDLVVAGLNCDGTSIESIEEGKMFGTTSQGPVLEGLATIETAEKLAVGEEVPKEVIPPYGPIYKSNVGKFKEECTY
jgi:ABC-type sugar transport system substrate-binding protein